MFNILQAIQLNPGSEIYKETLAFFEMNAQCYSDHLQKDKQGLSYASVTRGKSSVGNEKEKSSPEWNVKKTKLKENPSAKMPWSPAVSPSYYSDPYERATIENPWASFVNSNNRRKKTDSSPIDGLSEIDVPPVNDHFTESPLSKEVYKQHVREEVDSSFSSTLKTPISSQETTWEDGNTCTCTFDHEHENHVDTSDDHFGYKNGAYPEGLYTYSHNHDENLESKFLEELCMARETAIDDWAKYYDLLRSGLREEVPSMQSDVLGQNVPTTREYADSLDEIDESLNVRCKNHSGKDQSSSDKPASKSNKVCSKCGHFNGSGNLPSSPAKNRIHFVNGACVSSSSLPCCTCNKQSKGYSEGQSPKTPLSSSQQEFYRNLQNYFGNGKVKSRKTAMEAGKENSLKRNSGDLDLNSPTSCNSHDTNISSNSTKDPPKVASKQNIMEGGTVQSDNWTSKEHLSREVKNEGSSFDPTGCKTAKSSFDAEEVKKDKKSLGEERFQQASFKPKSRVDDKVKSRPKASKAEHVKNSKEGASQRVDSHRQARPKVGVKSRVSHRVKAEDTTRTVPASDVKERLSKHRTEGIVQEEIDVTKLFYSLYCTGTVHFTF